MRDRIFQISWGPGLENALLFGYPAVGGQARAWRDPRPGALLMPNGATNLAVIAGRWFKLAIEAQYFAAPQWAGALGLQAFLDWALDGNAFTLVPDVALPTLTVPGCYLLEPAIDPTPALDQASGTQGLRLVLYHPTADLGLAWRGLFLEYAAGQSLADPAAWTFARSSTEYEITPAGFLLSHAAGSPCDGNYPGGIAGAGLQTTLLQSAIVNDITFPEAIDNTAWAKNNAPVTANAGTAPDKNATADVIVPSAVSGNHYVQSAAYNIAAANIVAALIFVRANGYYRGRAYVHEGSFTDRVGVTYDLSLGTAAAFTSGAGVSMSAYVIPLAGGWFALYWRGTVNAGSTSVRLVLELLDNSGATTFTGDGTSGTYLWGATAVHGVPCPGLGGYVPGSQGADSLTTTWSPPPQAGWFYVKFVELGTLRTGYNASGGWFRIGTAGDRSIFFVMELGSPTISFYHRGSVDRSVGLNASAISYGDTVELLGLLLADGSVSMRMAVNGGAEVGTAPSAAFPDGLAAAWSSPILSLGEWSGSVDKGATGIAAFRSGPYVAAGPASIATIAAARYA